MPADLESANTASRTRRLASIKYVAAAYADSSMDR